MKNIIVLMALLIITFSLSKANAADAIEDDFVTNRIDEQTGLSYSHSTKEDNWILSGQYFINGDLMNAMELSGFEASLATKWGRYFLDFLVAQTTTKINEVANINSSSLKDLNIDFENTTYSITEIGVGLKLRSTLIQDFIQSKDYFDIISSHITYMSTTIEEESFSGPGLRASYGIFKRFGPSTQAGIKADYHLGVLSRSANESNTSVKTTLVTSWISTGLELSYYF